MPPAAAAHQCYVALVTSYDGPQAESRFLVRAGDELLRTLPEAQIYRFNFCPVCGKPMDWVAIARSRKLGDANPRLRILDAVRGGKPLPVVNIMQEPDGALLLIGDTFDMKTVEPFVAPDTEDTNEAG